MVWIWRPYFTTLWLFTMDLLYLSTWHICLVGGFKHGFYFPQYMGCHPSHWLSYFSRWLKPPTRWFFFVFVWDSISSPTDLVSCQGSGVYPHCRSLQPIRWQQVPVQPWSFALKKGPILEDAEQFSQDVIGSSYAYRCSTCELYSGGCYTASLTLGFSCFKTTKNH